MNIVKFTPGEYVPLAEYQMLKAQYQELVDSSTANIKSLVSQRYQLQMLIRRVLNFSPPLLDDCFDNGVAYEKLKQLFNDCREVLK